MRGINERFINDLKDGCLRFFFEQINTNKELCLEIRGKYISIYYKGGSALKISQQVKSYRFEFDSKYCNNKDDDRNFHYLNTLNNKDVKSYEDAFPIILKEMDSWFDKHPKSEREFQHNLIKANDGTNSIVHIMDIEYEGRTRENKRFRLDMLGIIKVLGAYKLIIFENKCGNGAVGGNAGIKKHYDDIVNILSYETTKNTLIDSLVNIVNNKTELGLCDIRLCKKDLSEIEILFVFADFNTKSKMIRNETSKIIPSIHAKLIFMYKTEKAIDYNNAKDLFAYEN